MRTAILTLCLLAYRATAAPVVIWATDPVGPGQTVVVTGDGFGAKPTVELTRLPDDPAGEPSGAAVMWPAVVAKPEALQAGETSLKFVVPPTSKPGVYAYRIAGGAAGLLNRPRIHWLQGDNGALARPGGGLDLFGVNLGGDGAIVRLSGKQTRRLKATAAACRLTVTLPADLPPGDYQVQAHSGLGGPMAWSKPVALTVARPEVWPAKVYNPRDMGAEGDGSREDTLAIQAALDAAGQAGGGIVLLPRGRYTVKGTLTIPPRTVLRGAGAASTCLCWPDTDDPPREMVRGTNRFTVEDLTIYAANQQHVLVADTGEKPDAGHVAFRRLVIRANAYRGHLKEEEVDQRFRASMKLSTGGGDSLRAGGPDVVVEDCDVMGTGRAIYLSRVSGGRVTGNRLANGRWGWYCISGSNGLVIANNQIVGADLMSTGGGLNCLDGSNASENVYYANNRLSMMHGWDRESMTSDAGGGPYIGGIASADGVRLTLATAPKWDRDWSGAGVFFLDGRGAGQVRRLVKHDGAVITLDRALDVAPDAKTVISITQYQGHYLLLNNDFSDCGAVQFYGTAIENVVAGNRGQRMSGFSAWALWYYGFQPAFYNLFEGNRLSEAYYHWTSAAPSAMGVAGHRHEGYAGPMNRGCIVRDNTLAHNAMVRVSGAVTDCVVERNAISDSDEGIFVANEATGVLCRENRFDNVLRPTMDEPAERALRAERLKRYIGAKDPLLKLDFDTLDGKVYRDGSTNHFDALLVGGVKPEPEGLRGPGVRFDGTGYLRVDETAAFNVPDVTLSLWVKPDVVSGRRGLISKRLPGGGCPFVLAQMGASVTFEAADEAGGWPFNFGGPAVLKVGDWTHIAAVVKADTGITLYAGGVKVAEKAIAKPRVPNGDPLIIGREGWGGDPPKGDTPGFYLGALDEITVWGRALSAEEVAALAKR